MTLEIKKRIEQIKNGEIPKGYKKGKLGIVPEDWEEVCFSSLFTSTSDYTDDLEKYPLYSLTIEDGITAKTDRYNRAHLVKKENSYKIVRPNDYAYNPMNIRFGAVARHKGDVPVAVSGYYDIFTTVNPGDLAFMDNFLTCGAMITYYNKVATGSLVEKQRVHFSDFFKFSLPLPSLEEREKIAKILSTQDKIIECYEKKIEQLRLMKKYYLQNMFSNRGETVPKIRFKGFTDAWEQRKFLEFSQRESACRESSSKFPSVEYEDVVPEEGRLNKDVRLKNAQKNGIVFDGTQVLYGKLRPYLHNWLTPDFKGVAVGDWWVLRPIEIERKFLYRLIQTPQFDDIANQSSGSKMPRADWNLVSNAEFIIPASLEEQRQIAETFDNLDHLITLHQRLCDEEKKKKKAMQQLLLTGIVRV